MPARKLFIRRSGRTPVGRVGDPRDALVERGSAGDSERVGVGQARGPEELGRAATDTHRH